MPNQMGRVLALTCVLSLSMAAWGQRAPMVRGKRIVTAKGLYSAKYVGRRKHDGREESEVIVTVNRTELNDIVMSNPADADSWWVWKAAQNGAGFVTPAEKALPDHPVHVSASRSGNDYVLSIDPNLMGLKDGDPLIVLVAGSRHTVAMDEPVVLNEQGLNLKAVRPPAVEALAVGGLSLAPNEQMEDGTRRFALHASLNYDKPEVNGGPIGARLHFISQNVLSTANTDKSAYFSGMLLAEKIRVLDDIFHTIPLAPFVRADASESFGNESWSVGIAAKIRLRGTRFGMGETIDSSRDAVLYLVPLQFQDRFRRTSGIPAWDTKANVLVSSATLLWEPIFLGSSKDVPDIDKDYSLHIGGNVWYFPDRGTAPGTEAKKVESRADIELQIPFEKLHLQKRIPIPMRLSVALGTGAVPSNGYEKTTSITVGVKTTF